ncbi:MAG: aspartate carbamoyltransferase catalytic subunit [Bdellovibrio sp. CG10_big_fil_rev_8_21_14_0_10_47_8]|nr:MAG: aspartate carbamoyltransferase catalytic subunit [Bdellovibrio sp. CG10_big_fil_rev_8_21_14_0_10_47_8]
MPASSLSLLNFQSFSSSQIESLFSFAEQLGSSKEGLKSWSGETAALLFFEASTRTRLSFESAAIRMGLGPLVFDGAQKTSLEKGESIEDSVLNIAAMSPRVLIIRCGDNVDLHLLQKKVSMPIVNAGWGVLGHPSQALLDTLTLRSRWKKTQGRKLLIVGDLKHSRVAASHFELMKLTGLEIGQCGPDEFLSKESSVQTFRDLKSGLAWADAVMALRFQFERHGNQVSLSKDDYRQRYGLNQNSLKELRSDGLILHPGPVNHGIELESEVFADSRCMIFEQVRWGVVMREALLRWLLGERP